MKVLLLPDIHGRKFWEKPCQNIDQYDKVIFIGDYVDPYDFEHITVNEAIENMEKIIELKKNNPDKVILLLGNHCMPYFSEEYYHLNPYHSRHSKNHHNEIHKLYNDNRDLFQLAYVIDDILFTHAGVTFTWFDNELETKNLNLQEIADEINSLLDSSKGLKKLFMVSYHRGGYDQYSSCIWADVNEMQSEYKEQDFASIKQIFGHTLQAYYGKNYEILYGNAVEFDNCKMIDNCKPYELDTETFTIKEI